MPDGSGFIPYYHVYARKRFEEVVPVNGNLFIEPMSMKEAADKYGVQTSQRFSHYFHNGKSSVKLGTVLLIGEPITAYKGDRYPLLSRIEPGDVVSFVDDFSMLPMEYRFKRTLFGAREVVRVHSSWITGKYDS
jgi:hypothetical protein